MTIPKGKLALIDFFLHFRQSSQNSQLFRSRLVSSLRLPGTGHRHSSGSCRVPASTPPPPPPGPPGPTWKITNYLNGLLPRYLPCPLGSSRALRGEMCRSYRLHALRLDHRQRRDVLHEGRWRQKVWRRSGRRQPRECLRSYSQVNGNQLELLLRFPRKWYCTVTSASRRL